MNPKQKNFTIGTTFILALLALAILVSDKFLSIALLAIAAITTWAIIKTNPKEENQ